MHAYNRSLGSFTGRRSGNHPETNTIINYLNCLTVKLVLVVLCCLRPYIQRCLRSSLPVVRLSDLPVKFKFGLQPWSQLARPGGHFQTLRTHQGLPEVLIAAATDFRPPCISIQVRLDVDHVIVGGPQVVVHGW
jgi:hypothetical protein